MQRERMRLEAGWRPRRWLKHRRALRAPVVVLMLLASLASAARPASSRGCAGTGHGKSLAAVAMASAAGTTVMPADETTSRVPGGGAAAPAIPCAAATALPAAPGPHGVMVPGRTDPGNHGPILRGVAAAEPPIGPPRLG